MYSADPHRYDTPKYRRSGKSGLLLPPLSLGFWHNFGENADYDNMVKIVETAFDNGICHFDLANNYGPKPGAAEANLGKILKNELAGYRDELCISTKAGYTMWPGPYGDMGGKKYLVASLDQSLKRMGLDYVDIFYHHHPDPDTPLLETCMALDGIVRSGKALYIGLSKYNKEECDAAVKIFRKLGTPFIVNQLRYNIFDRKIERNGTKDYLYKNGIGLVAFCPLAQGLLTGKYVNGIPADSRVVTDGRYLHEGDATNPHNIEKIRVLNDMAKERGQSLAQMALAWVLRDDAVTSALIGASKPEQILENLGAINNTEFSAEEIKRIDAFSL